MVCDACCVAVAVQAVQCPDDKLKYFVWGDTRSVTFLRFLFGQLSVVHHLLQ